MIAVYEILPLIKTGFSVGKKILPYIANSRFGKSIAGGAGFVAGDALAGHAFGKDSLVSVAADAGDTLYKMAKSGSLQKNKPEESENTKSEKNDSDNISVSPTPAISSEKEILPKTPTSSAWPNQEERLSRIPIASNGTNLHPALLGAGLATAGGLGYLAYKKMKNRKKELKNEVDQ